MTSPKHNIDCCPHQWDIAQRCVYCCSSHTRSGFMSPHPHLSLPDGGPTCHLRRSSPILPRTACIRQHRLSNPCQILSGSLVVLSFDTIFQFLAQLVVSLQNLSHVIQCALTAFCPISAWLVLDQGPEKTVPIARALANIHQLLVNDYAGKILSAQRFVHELFYLLIAFTFGIWVRIFCYTLPERCVPDST